MPQKLTDTEIKISIIKLMPPISSASFGGGIISPDLVTSFDSHLGMCYSPVTAKHGLQEAFRHMLSAATSKDPMRQLLVGPEEHRRVITGFDFETRSWTLAD